MKRRFFFYIEGMVKVLRQHPTFFRYESQLKEIADKVTNGYSQILNFPALASLLFCI